MTHRWSAAHVSMRLACTLAFASSPAALRAQEPETPGHAVPRPITANVSAAASVIEQQHERVKFEKDGSSRRELTLRVKVLDEQSVRQWGQLPLPYSSESEDLVVPTVEVHKPDGSVMKTAPASIQDVAVTLLPQAPMFLDLRQKVISVAGLRPGDTLVLSAVWITTRPIIPGQFWFGHTFSRQQVVLDERLEIDAPASMAVQLKMRPRSPPEERKGEGAVLGDRRIYRWKTSNAEVINAVGPTLDQLVDAPPPDVRLTTFTTWEEVGHWFRAILPKASNPSVEAKAIELTNSVKDPADKIEALYSYVSTQVRYVSLSFGLGRFAPHRPEEVLANQYGDCKDKAVLLGALLSAVGISSMPVLLNSARSVDPDFPSPSEFDHMVLVVLRPDGAESIWLDSTAEVAPIGVLMPPLRHRRGLLVGDAPHLSRLVTTPSDLPFEAVNRVDFESTVNELGVLTTRFTYTFHSDNELLARIALRALPRDSLPGLVKGIATTDGLQGDISSATASEPIDMREPLRISFTLRTRDFLNWAAETNDVRLHGSFFKLPGWTAEDRQGQATITLGMPTVVSVYGTVDFPQGYVPQAPVAVEALGPGVTYRSTYSASNTRLTITRELRTTAREVPSSQFAAYAAFARSVDADAGQRASVRSAAVPIPKVPSDATAMEVYAAAFSAYKASRYEAAATLWKHTTELDPKMGDAWVSLGLAYEQLGRHKEAVAAIRRQIEIDPYDKRAYADLGYVLRKSGQTREAADAYAKHVQLNPLDGENLRELGELYWNLRRDADAAAALERASVLVKNDGWVFALLGAAYLNLHQREKAIAAFDHALAIENSPAVWTKIGWALAVKGIDLKRASDLASRTISHASEVTRDLRLATLQDSHLDLMERLAWAWDTVGWVQFQKGNLAAAEEYEQAAWLLGGQSEIAYHFGRVCEKRNRLADALSFYLTAEATDSSAPPEVMTHIKRLSGGGDLTKMIDTARDMAASDRTFRLTTKRAAGQARFIAIIGSDRRVVELQQTKGGDGFGHIVNDLRQSSMPVRFPANSPSRLAVQIDVWCTANQVCWARTAYPSRQVAGDVEVAHH